MKAPFDVEEFRRELTMELVEIFAEAVEKDSAPMNQVHSDAEAVEISTDGD